MTTYNTGNPIGSTDPRDLYDNAQNFDSAVNADSDVWTDRKGVQRATFRAAERAANSAIQTEIPGHLDRVESAANSAIQAEIPVILSEIETVAFEEFNASQQSRSLEFDGSQSQREYEFNQFIASSGYEVIGDYAAGIVVTGHNQVIRDGGIGYRPSIATDLPYTTTGAGMPEGGAFVSVGDAVLRQELAGDESGSGAALVSMEGGPSVEVAIVALRADLGALTNSTTNVRTTNDAVTNTTNMAAAQTLAKASGKPILLAAGVYLINEFTLKAGVKILSLGVGGIEFRSEFHPIIRLEGGVVHKGTEFHGILNCTGSSAISASALLLLDADGTTIESVNFDYIQFKGLNRGVNGALIVAANGAGTNHSYIKSWSMRYATYETGRMGCEFLNQRGGLAVTGLTIGTEATFTCAEVFAEEGQTVLFEGLVGDSTVENLNGVFFIITNITSTTFQLKDTDGVKIGTAGGTYTSGGALRVFRGENIDLTGSRFLKTGAVSSSLGFGFSGDNALLNVDLTDAVVQDTPQYGLELVGISKCKVVNVTFQHCTGDPISASNLFGYGNIISGCQTTGMAAGRCFISLQKGMIWRDNNIYVKDKTTFATVSSSQIRGGTIKSRDGTSAVIFDGSFNNDVSDIVFDNSESSNNFSALRFFGAAATDNRVRYATILNGSGGATTDQAGGAAGNTVENFRTSISGLYDKGLPAPAPPYSSAANVGDWPRLPSSGIRESNFYSVSTGISLFRVKLLKTTGSGQTTSEFEFRYAGRNNNIPVGGKIGLAFGSASAFNATPSFYTLGSTATLEAVQIDGSGFPYWDITLPANNGSLLVVTQAAVRNDADAAFWHINILS